MELNDLRRSCCDLSKEIQPSIIGLFFEVSVQGIQRQDLVAPCKMYRGNVSPRRLLTSVRHENPHTVCAITDEQTLVSAMSEGLEVERGVQLILWLRNLCKEISVTFRCSVTYGIACVGKIFYGKTIF